MLFGIARNQMESQETPYKWFIDNEHLALAIYTFL